MVNYTLADGRRRVDVSLVRPDGFQVGEGPITVSLAELVPDLIPDAMQQVNFADYTMGPSGSDTLTEKPLGTRGNVSVFTASNFDANVTLLRSVTDGQPDDADTLFAAIGEKGVTSYWYNRNYKLATIPLEVGDRGWVYECTSDDPQEQGDEDGNIKTPIPLAVRNRREFIITA